MLTFREFLEEQKRIEEGWKDYVPSANTVSTFGRNFADKATMGGYKYARAGADYVVKKALGRKTTYQKELDQEKEKLAKGEKNEPMASVAGDVAGDVAASAALAAAPAVLAPVKTAKETGGYVASFLPRVKRALGY
jgi:hypothetical protein